MQRRVEHRMRGKYHVIVQNNKVHYEFDIRRNITILRGNSGTGKTTLMNMIELYSEQGENSGIQLICEKTCRTLPRRDWKMLLPNLHEQIFFLDEDFTDMKSDEFAAAVINSDNYFVLVTRENLPNLPYAVDEIYGIHASGKYHDLKRTYNEFYRIYGEIEPEKTVCPDLIITEDSNSGFEFFKAVMEEHRHGCESANGKSNIRKVIGTMNDGEKNILIVADGAAIGPEMNRLYFYLMHHSNVKMYLPESFEWIILKSGLIDGKRVKEILQEPEMHIDSSKYASWERYFTGLLVEMTEGSYLHYNKSHLNRVYLHEKNRKAILAVMENIQFR